MSKSINSNFDVDVSELDIFKGVPSNGHYCPIANAITRKLNSRLSVTVWSNNVSITVKGRPSPAAIFKLDDNGLKFIKDFDTSMTVGPTKIKLSRTRGHLDLDQVL